MSMYSFMAIHQKEGLQDLKQNKKQDMVKKLSFFSPITEK